ncbi:M14 family zinc carboxypeptidase [Brevibacterium aurantiacum]|uniref:Peptidase M14 n=1 Tax=Brevibacterium aurantiacum TaxID=273384 RepID=A0A556C5W4_BREAU|nr:M14 family zinc carboxypeptidase [Brevibacterium aurantiacum]TSI12844.1 peptidase M14 [Brevibacterium aurantiacum]
MIPDQTMQSVSDAEIVERATALPEFHAFPTVDELLARLESLRVEFPDLLTVRRIGTSRLGEPISLYTLNVDRHHPSSAPSRDAYEHEGSGEPRNRGLIVGGVHPNEPIGSLTIIQVLTDLLADNVLRERLNIEWHVIPCADPDAMRLNEGWFSAPFDGETYFRNFYRPPGNEQVEWTFPVSYKEKYFDEMMPETQALQRVIDDVRPDFYVPLHNSETGGAYYYMSQSLSDMVPLLHRLPAEFGIPLHLGEPESAHSQVVAPAVFAAGSVERVYEWREANGLDPVPEGGAGQSSTSYARRYGTVSLIAELPIWKTFGADDTSHSTANYAALLREAGEALMATGNQLTELMRQVHRNLTLDSPFLRSARAFIPGMYRAGELMMRRATMPENDRLATVAERPLSIVWMYRLRYGGALLRALSAEVAAGMAGVRVRRAADDLEAIWSRWLSQRLAREQTEGIPIRGVVGVQYGAVIGLAARARALGETDRTNSTSSVVNDLPKVEEGRR